MLLNLLIAIISKSFEEINKKSTLAAYQEKARIIFENDFIIPKSALNSEPQSRFITVIKKHNPAHDDHLKKKN